MQAETCAQGGKRSDYLGSNPLRGLCYSSGELWAEEGNTTEVTIEGWMEEEDKISREVTIAQT